MEHFGDSNENYSDNVLFRCELEAEKEMKYAPHNITLFSAKINYFILLFFRLIDSANCSSFCIKLKYELKQFDTMKIQSNLTINRNLENQMNTRIEMKIAMCQLWWRHKHKLNAVPSSCVDFDRTKDQTN